MTTGKLYFDGGKEKIEEKIETLAKLHLHDKTNPIDYVAINRSDAEAEDLSDDDIISGYKIKLSVGIIRNHFWFVEENKP